MIITTSHVIILQANDAINNNITSNCDNDKNIVINTDNANWHIMNNNIDNKLW